MAECVKSACDGTTRAFVEHDAWVSIARGGPDVFDLKPVIVIDTRERELDFVVQYEARSCEGLVDGAHERGSVRVIRSANALA